MKRIRSGTGIGDNLYLQAIVRYLVSVGAKLEVCTSYPELFPLDVKFAPWSRNADYHCHYAHNMTSQKTNQWQDCCARVGVKAELKIDWKPKNKALIASVLAKAGGRPIMFVNGARLPFNREDKYGRELMPKETVYHYVLSRLREKFFTVYCGKVKRVHPVAVDLDLNGQTSVTDMMDIASISSAFFGQCSFIVPLAESFDQPLLALWASRGLKSRDAYIRTITPKKVLSKNTSTHVIDDWEPERLNGRIGQFCNA